MASRAQCPFLKTKEDWLIICGISSTLLCKFSRNWSVAPFFFTIFIFYAYIMNHVYICRDEKFIIFFFDNIILSFCARFSPDFGKGFLDFDPNKQFWLLLVNSSFKNHFVYNSLHFRGRALSTFTTDYSFRGRSKAPNSEAKAGSK